MTCGIYKLKFTGTDKVYIGLSDNIERRLVSHRHSLLTRQSPKKLQEAFNTYGMPILEVLLECNKDELDTYEKEAIDIYDSIDNGFNSRNGGVCGAGVAISGENNGRSKYSNEQILQAFNLLTTTKLTNQEIAITTGISKEAVSHISAGTGHTWISKYCPIEYAKLVSMKRDTKVSRFPLNIGDEESGTVHSVNSYDEIQKLIDCAYSTAVCLVSGEIQRLFNRWILEVPVSLNRSKKQEYTLRNIHTGAEQTFTSKLKFFTENGLSNRSKFTKFLESNELGAVYQDWVLLSVR